MIKSNSLATVCEKKFFAIARINITHNSINTSVDLRAFLDHYVYGGSTCCIGFKDAVKLTIARLLSFHFLLTVL